MSLRIRLALFGAIAILIALAVAFYGLSALFAAHAERRAVEELEIQLDQVIAGLSNQPGGLIVEQPPTDPRFMQPYGGRYWQVSGAGNIARSRSLWDLELDPAPAISDDGGVQVFRQTGPEGEPLLIAGRVVQLPAALGGGRVDALVGMDSSEIDSARRAFARDLIPYLALLSVVLIGAQLVQLTFGLRPLAAIGAHIAALRSGKESRMGDHWPGEIQPLAREIDGLLDARDTALERARFRAADLAHGLKTPLQALLGEVARLKRKGETGSATAIEDIADAMRAHVERELTRTRTSTHPVQVQAQLAPVVQRIVEVLRRTPSGEEIVWHIEVDPAHHVGLEPADLTEAIGALAENAVRHARSRVTFRSETANASICLRICDDGEGIPEAALQAVMQRGKRLDETGNGTGLGLSIAAEIAEAAGGQLHLESAPSGTTATLELPGLVR